MRDPDGDDPLGKIVGRCRWVRLSAPPSPMKMAIATEFSCQNSSE